MRFSLSVIHTFIHIYQYTNSVWRPCDSEVLTVQQPHTMINSKWNKSALLNLSIGDKYNNVVIFIPQNNKENMNTHILKKRMCGFMIHTYTYIQHVYELDTGQERVL